MAKSVLDIIIKTIKQGGGDKDTVKGLVQVKNAVSQAGVAFAALAGVAYTFDQVLDATVGKAVEYANKVETVANATGQSAEDSSRLIQVTDDLRLSYEDLTASIKKNSDVTDFSVEGLATLSAEYLTLGTVTERQAFAQEHFGKQWVEFIKVMEAGPEKLRAMNDAVSENLIMTEQAKKASQDYQLQIDNLTDSWEGFKISIGTSALPGVVTLLEKINMEIEEENGSLFQAEKGWRMLLGPIGAVWNLIDLFGNDTGAKDQLDAIANAQNDIASGAADMEDAHSRAAAGMAEIGSAAEELAVNYGGLLDMTMNLQEGFDKFAEKEAEIKAKMDEANAAFQNGTMSAAEHQQKMAELSGELDQNAAAMEDWSKRTVFALVQARLAASDGIDANEFAFLIGLGEQMGIIDSKTAEMAQKINDGLNSIDTSQGQESVDAFADMWNDLLDKPHEQTFTITTVTTETTDTSGSDQTGIDSGWCFLAGTLITLGNGDRREIQDMVSGDFVLTMDPETGATMQARVGRVFLHESDHYYAMGLSNGKTLRVTGEHPMWATPSVGVPTSPPNGEEQERHLGESGRWVTAKELCVGWRLREMENGVAIETIRRVEGRIPVYNLHVEHAWHTYFADGVLAHNKATGGVVRAPGGGLQDTVMVPMAAGEGVLNARAMAMPGMDNFLRAANAGAMPAGGDKRVTIYGGVTVVVQQSADLKNVLTDIG